MGEQIRSSLVAGHMLTEEEEAALRAEAEEEAARDSHSAEAAALHLHGVQSRLARGHVLTEKEMLKLLGASYKVNVATVS